MVDGGHSKVVTDWPTYRAIGMMQINAVTVSGINENHKNAVDEDDS